MSDNPIARRHLVGVLAGAGATSLACAAQAAPRALSMAGLGRYGVEVYLCRITFETNKIDSALAKDAQYLRFVLSGVAAVAMLQAKCFSYLKVG